MEFQVEQLEEVPPQTDAQVQCSENGGLCPTTADAQVQWPEVAEETEKKEEARGGGRGGKGENGGEREEGGGGWRTKRGRTFSSNGTK